MPALPELPVLHPTAAVPSPHLRIASGSLSQVPERGALLLCLPSDTAASTSLRALLHQRRPDLLDGTAPSLTQAAAMAHLAAGGALLCCIATPRRAWVLRRRSGVDLPGLLAAQTVPVQPLRLDRPASWSPRRATLLHLGDVLPAAELARIDVAAQGAYLRLLCQALGGSSAVAPEQRPLAPLAAPVAAERLAAEIDALPASCCLLRQGEFAVYCAPAAPIPGVLDEIGRLRELSFRAVQEGSGLPADLDRYDAHYQHLWLWHAPSRQIIGAYRLGFTATLAAPQALYTHSLFDYDQRLLARIGPSLELGRSFVRPEWQRSFRALRLLWSGIVQVLDAHPQLQYLFGPVSISGGYSALSRKLMELALTRHHGERSLQSLVRPRTPARYAAGDRVTPTVAAALAEPALLSRAVSRVGSGAGLPVLLRHYLELRGRFAGFNVDADFGGTLDGLVFVAVADIPPRIRAKFSASSASSDDA